MAKLKIIKMSDIKPEPVDWLWKPYIPFGAITVIQGDGGEGKTTSSLAIAAAVSTGEPLPGSYGNINLAHIIIQNAEDSYSQVIHPRLERFGADCDMIHVIDETECELTLSDKRIEQTIAEKQAKLFILDPIQAYLGGADMNSTTAVRPLMKSLAGVADRTGCAIVLVGHLNKGGGKSQYRTLGSIDIAAAARSIMTVGKLPGDDSKRVIVHNKSNLAPNGKSQMFELGEVGFCWCGECDVTIDELLSGKPKKETQSDKARRILTSVLAHGPVLATEIEQIAEDEGISLKTFKRAKDAIGAISFRRDGQWYWDIPIEAEYTECPSEEGQDSQEGHATAIVPLAI